MDDSGRSVLGKRGAAAEPGGREAFHDPGPEAMNGELQPSQKPQVAGSFGEFFLTYIAVF
jgi:hypothetical protein